MSTQVKNSDTSIKTKSTLTEDASNAIQQGVKQINQGTQVAKEKALDVVPEGEEKLAKEVKLLNGNVYTQLTHFKQDLLSRIDVVKGQVNLSPKDILELKDFIKEELNTVLDDLSKLGQALKQDVSQISLKHKEQLTSTLKRSKEHTLEAWHKVSTKQ